MAGVGSMTVECSSRERRTGTSSEFYETDVLSAVRMIRAAVPGMKARGWGRIIQIGTGLANTPKPVLADYAAAKAALVNLTVSLAKAVAGTNIKVNTISPGLINTVAVETVLRRAAERLAGYSEELV